MIPQNLQLDNSINCFILSVQEWAAQWLTHPMPQHQWYGLIVGVINWAASNQQHWTSQQETQEDCCHPGPWNKHIKGSVRILFWKIHNYLFPSSLFTIALRHNSARQPEQWQINLTPYLLLITGLWAIVCTCIKITKTCNKIQCHIKNTSSIVQCKH